MQPIIPSTKTIRTDSYIIEQLKEIKKKKEFTSINRVLKEIIFYYKYGGGQDKKPIL
jgi:hypothetical protein